MPGKLQHSLPQKKGALCHENEAAGIVGGCHA